MTKSAVSPTKRRTWRTKKASDTRYRLLEATLDCLVEIGYTNTSITTIAEKAGVSRGAMQFHFPTKLSAMEAVVTHILRRRLDTYRADMAKIRPNEDFLEHAINAYWKQVTRPEFVAQQELALAARTDSHLARVMGRAYREYVAQSREPFLEHFPRWKTSRTRYEMAANFAQYLIEGMAVGYANHHLTDDAVNDLLRHLSATVGQILEVQPRNVRRRIPRH